MVREFRRLNGLNNSVGSKDSKYIGPTLDLSIPNREQSAPGLGGLPQVAAVAANGLAGS